MREHLNYLSKDIVNVSLICIFAYLLSSFSAGTFNISLWEASFRGFVVFVTSTVSAAVVVMRRMPKY